MLLWIFAGQDETFHLVIGGIFLCLQLFIFTTIQEFIYCYKKLTSWWCFPREMSGIHKNRINLCFGSLFHLECRACLLKKLMTCHVVSFWSVTAKSVNWVVRRTAFPLSQMLSSCHSFILPTRSWQGSWKDGCSYYKQINVELCILSQRFLRAKLKISAPDL